MTAPAQRCNTAHFSLASERLRSQTAAIHRQVENLPKMQRLLCASLEQAEYAAIQARFFGVYAPSERALDDAAFWAKSDLPAPRRAPRLAKDLATLGLEASTLPLAEVSMAHDQADLLGRLYVLEGSQLGGRAIDRCLRMHSWYADTTCGRFFQDIDVGRWAAVKRWLDSALDDQNKLDAAIRSAVRTFSTIGDWMQND